MVSGPSPVHKVHAPTNPAGVERGRMEAVGQVLSALIPPGVVAGAVIYAVVKLVKSEAAERRAYPEDRVEGPELTQ